MMIDWIGIRLLSGDLGRSLIVKAARKLLVFALSYLYKLAKQFFRVRPVTFRRVALANNHCILVSCTINDTNLTRNNFIVCHLTSSIAYFEKLFSMLPMLHD